MEVAVRCERVSALLPDDESFAVACRALPDWRRRKCDALRFAQDRRRSVAAWLLLGQVLAMRGLQADNQSVSETEFGKPVFDRMPDVHFSISHAGDRVMVAVSDAPVGCDVEPIGSVDDSVCRGALSADEFRCLEAVPAGNGRDREFCRLWTRKESYLKALGRGLDLDPRGFSIRDGRVPSGWQLTDFDFGDGYCGCVCAVAGAVIRR